MKKFYAVRAGRNVGVYNSWKECQAQTNGFKGAKYQGFSTKQEAINFINEAKDTALIDAIKLVVVPKVPDFTIYDRAMLDTADNLIIVYIDGSKRPLPDGKLHRGSGGYCRFNHTDYWLSVPFTEQIADRYRFNKHEMSEMASPTMECIALLEVLFRFIYVKKDRNTHLDLVFVSDYEGVKNFVEKSWIPKEDYTIKLTNDAHKIINFLKMFSIDVHVKHCDGHSNFLGNEMSDICAKSPEARDSFKKLVEDVSSKFT